MTNLVVLILLIYVSFLQVMFSIASIQAHPGQSVTMWCSHNIHVSGYLYWFKQTDGAVPITIVDMLYTESLQKFEPNYFNNFTKDHMVMDQFSKSTGLTIKQVKMSDSGFYFCGATGYHMKFGNGTRLQVKGNLFEHEFNPGDSVNLHCSVLTEKCVGHHSIYWFRHESGDTHPGIIYKHGNINDQCEKSSEKDSHVQSCIYNLPKKNLSLTDAGTYYCAVAMCGEILFGNGSSNTVLYVCTTIIKRMPLFHQNFCLF
uniref:Novel immune-type receptor 12 n=1 Tax=Sinocyclocheilus anshuiensis TaxID=1608454 RepID=A0A671LRQ3_9TELE